MAQPLLGVVSGPAGSGTTTLARTLARAVPCPAISRDEIKEGLVDAEGEYTPAPADQVAQRAFEAFFGVLRYLHASGASVVAEASFQHGLWLRGLEPQLATARVRVVRCHVDAAVARDRIARRADDDAARRAIHGDSSLLEPFETWKPRFESFQPLDLPVPSLDIDTADGYEPPLEAIVAFVKA